MEDTTKYLNSIIQKRTKHRQGNSLSLSITSGEASSVFKMQGLTLKKKEKQQVENNNKQSNRKMFSSLCSPSTLPVDTSKIEYLAISKRIQRKSFNINDFPDQNDKKSNISRQTINPFQKRSGNRIFCHYTKPFDHEVHTKENLILKSETREEGKRRKKIFGDR